MSRKKRIRNNIVNIDFNGNHYSNIASYIQMIMADQYGVELDGLFKIIGADTYFLHYMISPILLDEPNDFLPLEIIRLLFKKYMTSKKYVRIKQLTTLDHKYSTVYTIAFLKKFMQEIKRFGGQMAGGSAGQEKQGEQESQGERQGDQEGKGQGEGGGEGEGQDQKNKGSGSSGEGDSEGKEDAGSGGGAGSDLFDEIRQLITKSHDIEKLFSNLNQNTINYIFNSAVRHASKVLDRTIEIIKVFGGRMAGKDPGTLARISELSLINARVNQILKKALEIQKSITVGSGGYFGWLGEEVYSATKTRSLRRARVQSIVVEELFLNSVVSGFPALFKKSFGKKNIILLLDKSGSMAEKNKPVWSRSVALALFSLATKYKSDFYLVFFDHVVYNPMSDPVEIMDGIARIGCNGGTNITRALKKAIEIVRKTGKPASIILVTDGFDIIDIEDIRVFAKKVRDKINIISVMIQGENEKLMKLAEMFRGEYLSVQLDNEGTLNIVNALTKEMKRKELL